MSRWSIQKS